MKGVQGRARARCRLSRGGAVGRAYEIARYGTQKTWAAELGMDQAVKPLEVTLVQEKKTDETLTMLAESEVNQQRAGRVKAAFHRWAGGVAAAGRGIRPLSQG
jgi:hypothetical protein